MLRCWFLIAPNFDLQPILDFISAHPLYILRVSSYKTFHPKTKFLTQLNAHFVHILILCGNLIHCARNTLVPSLFPK